MTTTNLFVESLEKSRMVAVNHPGARWMNPGRVWSGPSKHMQGAKLGGHPQRTIPHG